MAGLQDDDYDVDMGDSTDDEIDEFNDDAMANYDAVSYQGEYIREAVTSLLQWEGPADPPVKEFYEGDPGSGYLNCVIRSSLGDGEGHTNKAHLRHCSGVMHRDKSFMLDEVTEFVLQGVSGVGLPALVRLMHTGQINLHANTIRPIFAAAQALELAIGIDACRNFLECRLSPSRAPFLLDVCREFEPQRVPHVTGYLQRHLWGLRSRSLQDYRQYLWQLTQDQLVSVLSAHSLVVDNEVQAYCILKDWTQHHLPLVQVENIPANLFGCVRFAAMSRSDIRELLSLEPALHGSQHVMNEIMGRLLQPNRGLHPARPTARNAVWDVRSKLFNLSERGAQSEEFEWAGAEWALEIVPLGKDVGIEVNLLLMSQPGGVSQFSLAGGLFEVFYEGPSDLVCYKSEALGRRMFSAQAHVTTYQIHVLSGEDYNKLKDLIGPGNVGLVFKLLLRSRRWPFP